MTPFLTFSPLLMTLSRLVLGVFQTGVFPASYVLMYKWFPLTERSFAFGTVLNGAAVGSITGNAMSGWVSEHHGWSMVFYVSAIVALVNFIIFVPSVTSNPEQHKLVSKSELVKIKQGTETEVVKQTKRPVPWLTILKSRRVLGVLLYKLLDCQYSFISAKIPTYMSQIMRVNTTKVTKNGDSRWSMFFSNSSKLDCV